MIINEIKEKWGVVKEKVLKSDIIQQNLALNFHAKLIDLVGEVYTFCN